MTIAAVANTNESMSTPQVSTKPSHQSGLVPWKPGQSGNPSGRPAIVKEIRALAQTEAPALFQVLIDMAKDPKRKDQVRVTAIKEILKIAGVAVVDVAIQSTPGVDVPVATMSTKDLLAAIRGLPSPTQESK